MKILLMVLTVLVSISAQAITCNVVIYTDAEIVDGVFEAPVKSNGHNVPETTLKGDYNEVTVMADGKWLGISWKQGSELVAESINLIKETAQQPRVLITYNPKNTDEQVSLDCAPK